MSDAKPTYGEPVQEPAPVDDVVGTANEGLAEAEAARAQSGPVPVIEDSAPADEAAAESAAPSEESSVPAAESVPAEESEPEEQPAVEPEPEPVADAAAEPAYAPITDVPSDEPAAAAPAETAPEPAYTTPLMGQPIFVQAPEAPRPRGNRAAAGAIGLLAALAFGVLYLGAWLALGALTGDVDSANVGQAAVDALATWTLWVPIVVFYFAFWLLGAIINRGRWSAWVIFGLLVGAAAYGGYLLGVLFEAPFWMVSASEGATLVKDALFAPLAIASFVFARELTIWFGAWVSARGKRVTELNIEAQREYERTLEAGPQLVRP